MHHFQDRNGRLHAEDVDLTALAERVGTPFYCYSTATLERHYRVFAEAFAGDDALVCFAMKANSNQAVLATLARKGAGMDIVSEGELLRALRAGVEAQKIVFSGVGKTRDEMAAALHAGIYCFNVESEPELLALSEVATSLGIDAPVSIRVNPDIDAGGHAKISTGKYENKFGIPITRAPAVYALAATLPGPRDPRRRHAYRQPDHGPRAVRERSAAPRRPRRTADRRRASDPPHRFRRRPRHSLSRRQCTAAGPGGARSHDPPAFRGARPAAGLRDRPDDRGQCRNPRHPPCST